MTAFLLILRAAHDVNDVNTWLLPTMCRRDLFPEVGQASDIGLDRATARQLAFVIWMGAVATPLVLCHSVIPRKDKARWAAAWALTWGCVSAAFAAWGSPLPWLTAAALDWYAAGSPRSGYTPLPWDPRYEFGPVWVYQLGCPGYAGAWMAATSVVLRGLSHATSGGPCSKREACVAYSSLGLLALWALRAVCPLGPGVPVLDQALVSFALALVGLLLTGVEGAHSRICAPLGRLASAVAVSTAVGAALGVIFSEVSALLGFWPDLPRAHLYPALRTVLGWTLALTAALGLVAAWALRPPLKAWAAYVPSFPLALIFMVAATSLFGPITGLHLPLCPPILTLMGGYVTDPREEAMCAVITLRYLVCALGLGNTLKSALVHASEAPAHILIGVGLIVMAFSGFWSPYYAASFLRVGLPLMAGRGANVPELIGPGEMAALGWPLGIFSLREPYPSPLWGLLPAFPW